MLDGKDGGLPLTFHEKVLEICGGMGGAAGDLAKSLEPHIGSLSCLGPTNWKIVGKFLRTGNTPTAELGDRVHVI